MTGSYLLAGVSFRVDSHLPFADGRFAGYTYSGRPDVTVSLSVSDVIGVPQCAPTKLLPDKSVYMLHGGGCRLLFHEGERVYASSVCTSGAVSVTCLRGKENYFSSAKAIFAHIGFERTLALHGAVLLHASLVLTERGGILFSGPSGTGKTTQAMLLERSGAGRMINGDRAALRADGAPTAHGLPYSGSSDRFERGDAPVRAVVFPVKGAENKLDRVSPSEAFRMIYSECTAFPWDASAAASAADVISAVCKEVPVYRYTATKEPGSADYLRAELLC